MNLSGFWFQFVNGLAGASSLFLVAAGLSLIFGVTRIVNFAHGSFYMLGLYVAYSLTEQLQGWGGFWLAVPLSALALGALGAGVEMVLLRRIYRSPELFQLLATFALVLVLQDAALWTWGAQDLLGPRAPGLRGAIEVLSRPIPSYDLFLIALAPAVLLALWLLLHKTRWGLLVRASTQDREMTGALGVRPALLFTSVFALGSALAGLGGALQLPREPASLALDLATVTDAFVVVVIGGLGSVPGAFVAALLVAQVKALCIGLGTVEWGQWSFSFSKLTLVAEFLVMAGVLLVRPWGLWGRAPTPATIALDIQRTPREMKPRWSWAVLCCAVLLVLWPWFLEGFPYALILGVDMAVAVLFAASLHFIMGPGGLHSFGHAAYFGVGAYAAAWMLLGLGWPLEVSLVLAPVVCLVLALLLGWFSLRLAGIYLAMLTLACSQILWAVAFQWDDVTGGSNGLNGVWPSAWLTDKRSYYTLTVLLAIGAVASLRRLFFSPFGFALRAARDSTPRAQAIGIHTRQVQWLAFGVAGLVAGLAGVLSVFSKGSVSPDALGVSRSVDGLVTVLLGGVHSLAAPVLGAVTLTWLQDTVMRNTEYWRALLGALMLGIVLLAPGGLAGSANTVAEMLSRWRRRGAP